MDQPLPSHTGKVPGLPAANAASRQVDSVPPNLKSADASSQNSPILEEISDQTVGRPTAAAGLLSEQNGERFQAREVGRAEGVPEYAILLAARHAAHRAELQNAVNKLFGGQQLMALDVASGDGFFTDLLAATLAPGSQVAAVDTSSGFLEWSSQADWMGEGNRREPRFLKGDANALPFKENTFDLVWCAQSLISLPDPVRALQEMQRVVKPGGHVGILENDRLHEMQLAWPVSLEFALRHAERDDPESDASNDAPYAGRDLERLLRKANLQPCYRQMIPVYRQPPLSAADHAFLEAYFHTLIERTRNRLSQQELHQLLKLTTPGSPDYLPAGADFWMVWTDWVVMARKHSS